MWRAGTRMTWKRQKLLGGARSQCHRHLDWCHGGPQGPGAGQASRSLPSSSTQTAWAGSCMQQWKHNPLMKTRPVAFRQLGWSLGCPFPHFCYPGWAQSSRDVYQAAEPGPASQEVSVVLPHRPPAVSSLPKGDSIPKRTKRCGQVLWSKCLGQLSSARPPLISAHALLMDSCDASCTQCCIVPVFMHISCSALSPHSNSYGSLEHCTEVVMHTQEQLYQPQPRVSITAPSYWNLSGAKTCLCCSEWLQSPSGWPPSFPQRGCSPAFLPSDSKAESAVFVAMTVSFLTALPFLLQATQNNLLFFFFF